MTEKGFATIFGLCLILVIALIVKGIQEAEMNHAYETTDFQAEFDLQNAADSALVETVNEAIELLDADDTRLINRGTVNRRYSQYEFPAVTKTSERLGNITVTVWCEETMIQPYKVNYSRVNNRKKHNYDGYVAEKKGTGKYGYFFFSRAEATNKHAGGKIYRRAAAYVLQSENYKTIHFVEVPTREYIFEKK